MNKRVLSLATVLACAMPLFSCSDDPPPSEPVVRPIKVLELDGMLTSGVLEFPATVQAGTRSQMGFEVHGQIIELPVVEGQVVTRGTLLGRVDPRDYQSELDAGMARARAADAERERTQKLFDETVTSQQQLDRAIRNHEVTLTIVERAQKAVDDTSLRAPFDGVVARIMAENFETVQAKQPILLLENDSIFKVVANIPEQDTAQIEPNLSLEELSDRTQPEIQISALGNRVFKARITEFARAADPRTRTFALTLTFDNPGEANLASGMTAIARFRVSDDVSAAAGMLIPANAVISDTGGDPIVWVVDPVTMQAKSRRIELGMPSGESILIESGLQGDEWIAVSGVNFLNDGVVVSRLNEK